MVPTKTMFATYAPYLIATWGIALAGIAGGFVFGIASDRKFGGRRAPVITFGFLGMAVILALFGISDMMALGPIAAACCLVLLSFCVNGAHGMISGAASMDFGGKKAVATAAGLFDGMQYLAGAFVGVGVGYITTRWAGKHGTGRRFRLRSPVRSSCPACGTLCRKAAEDIKES